MLRWWRKHLHPNRRVRALLFPRRESTFRRWWLRKLGHASVSAALTNWLPQQCDTYYLLFCFNKIHVWFDVIFSSFESKAYRKELFYPTKIGVSSAYILSSSYSICGLYWVYTLLLLDVMLSSLGRIIPVTLLIVWLYNEQSLQIFYYLASISSFSRTPYPLRLL